MMYIVRIVVFDYMDVYILEVSGEKLCVVLLGDVVHTSSCIYLV